MQKVTVLCVGKLKEAFYAAAVAEYQKRLQRHCKLEIVELADEKTPEGVGPAEEDAIREREGKSVDALFREVFRTTGIEGGAF